MSGPPGALCRVRRLLDRVYALSAGLAGLCLIALLLVIVVQMVARWSGHIVPGGAEYAGYLMAAASFLAFASALNHGAHIRVGILLNALGDRRRRAEFLCLVIGSAITFYLAWYAVRLVYWSWRLGDVSQGQDRSPLWLAQMPMAFGAILLAVCFIDNLITMIVSGRDNISHSAEEQSHGE